MRVSTFYCLVGSLLGLGAPVGSLILRIASHPHSNLLALLAHEWQGASYYYLYMSIGTTLAFGLFGYALGRRNEDLSRLSVTDGLTALYNHRYLQEALSHEISRSDRYHTAITCLMADVDDFKTANDRFGHLFGDRVLATIGRLIRNSVRLTDVVGRYGGEEFLVIMPQTDSPSALPLAERIVKTVSEHTFLSDDKKPVHITLSIGLATYPDREQGVKTKNALLSAVDQAMYKAKRSGKNRVMIWRS